MPWAWWNEKASVVAKTMKLQMYSQFAWDEYLAELSPEERQKNVPRALSADFTLFNWQVGIICICTHVVMRNWLIKYFKCSCLTKILKMIRMVCVQSES